VIDPAREYFPVWIIRLPPWIKIEERAELFQEESQSIPIAMRELRKYLGHGICNQLLGKFDFP
jgi:hypothetical protein